MNIRCPSARKIDLGYLLDHRIVFSVPGQYWDEDGVATVRRSPGAVVFGVIWKVSIFEMLKMDSFEGMHNYSKAECTVYATSNKQFQCIIYKSDNTEAEKPSVGYLELLINSAIEQQLPESYISKLREWGDPCI